MPSVKVKGRRCEGADHSPSTHAEQSEFETYFRSVLNTVPPKQRETFCMRYYDELSYEEISAITGTSEGALKANYHWAVKRSLLPFEQVNTTRSSLIMSKPNTMSSAQEELRALLAEEFSEQEARALASSFTHTAEQIHREADAATRNLSVFVHEARQRAHRPRRGLFLGFAATALTAAAAVVIVLREEPVPTQAPIALQPTALQTERIVEPVALPTAVETPQRNTRTRSVPTTDVAAILADAEEEQIIETITQSVSETTTWTLQESEDLRKMRLLDVLNLQGDQVEKFFSAYNRYQGAVINAKKDLDRKAIDLREATESGADESVLKGKTDAVLAAMKVFEEAINKRHAEVKSLPQRSTIRYLHCV
ncbi:MAG: sigma-70 family RNA polymerase sigma factor [Ignavibacteria bacterium]|nr:sigma-70 family RNA polymerase sigma factor [Ignavibacteria bacterium]